MKDTEKKKREKKITAHSNGFCAFYFVVFIVFLVFSILGVIGFSISVNLKSKNNVFRYCLQLDGDNVFERQAGGGDSYFGFGVIKFDLSEKLLKYDLSVVLSGESPTSMFIKKATNKNPLVGNVVIPETEESFPIIFSDNIIKGKLTVQSNIIKDLIKEPHLHYLIIGTTKYPLGAIAGRFGQECNEFIE